MNFLKTTVVVMCLSISVSIQDARAAIYDIDLNLGNLTDISIIKDVIGSGWEIICTQSIFGTCLGWGTSPTMDHHVNVHLVNGTTEVFNVNDNTSYADQSGLAQGYFSFTPAPGTTGSLTATDNAYYDFFFTEELYDINLDIVDPDRFRYTDSDGNRFYIHADAGLYRATDVGGTSIEFNVYGILTAISTGGVAGDFVRDSNGRLFEIGSDVAVPLPASIWLLSAGVLVLSGMGRKRIGVKN